MIDRQVIFNKVWNWFIVERHPLCIDQDGKCLYTSSDGTNHCAIGLLLPEELAAEIPNNGIGLLLASRVTEDTVDGKLILAVRSKVWSAFGVDLDEQAKFTYSNGHIMLSDELSEHVKFLSTLQGTHDCLSEYILIEPDKDAQLMKLKDRLLEFAERYDLRIPVTA